MQVKSALGSQVGEAYIALRASQAKLGSDIAGATLAMKSKLASAGLAMGRNFGEKFSAGYRGAIEKLNGLVTGTLLGGAAAGAGFIGWGIKLQADAEMAEVAFSTMLNSGEKAKLLLGDLKKFAIETPFEFPELRDGAKNLLAMGFSAEEIVPTLRKLGDLAAGLNIPISELSTLWGQFRTQNRIFTGDLRQLSTRGVPVLRELSKAFGMNEEAILKMAEEGKLEFKHLAKVLDSLTSKGGQFAGLMEKSSQTLAGKFSTLKDEVAEVAMAMAEGITPAVRDLVGSVSESMPEIQSAAQSIGDLMADAFNTNNIQTFTAALMDSVDALRLMGAYFDEAQLGAARLARIAAVLNPAIQAWRVAGHEDEYQGMLSAFDAGIKTLAEEATTRDPVTGKIRNNTDILTENFGKRSRELEDQYRNRKRTPPKWLQDQVKNIQNFNRQDTPFVKRIFEMQDSFKLFGKNLLGEVGKNLLGRTPGELLAAGAGRAAKAMTPENKYLRGGFTSFQDLNRQIQESLLQDNSSKQTAQNTKTQNDLTKKANDILKDVKAGIKKWSVWVS